MLIVQNLRELGMKPVDLTRLMGVNPGTTSKLINGKCRLSVQMSLRLSAALRLPETYWLDMMVRAERERIGLMLDRIKAESHKTLPVFRQTELIMA